MGFGMQSASLLRDGHESILNMVFSKLIREIHEVACQNRSESCPKRLLEKSILTRVDNNVKRDILKDIIH